jgi:hypothetical protein
MHAAEYFFSAETGLTGKCGNEFAVTSQLQRSVVAP